MINDPKLVILDEPISGLDPAQIVEMRKVVRNLGTNRAVILSSHILSEVSATCDRILVIGGGQLVAQGTEAELVPVPAPTTGSSSLSAATRGVRAVARPNAEGRAGLASGAAGTGLAAAMVDMKVTGASSSCRSLRGRFGIRLVEAPEDELEEIFLGLTTRRRQHERPLIARRDLASYLQGYSAYIIIAGLLSSTACSSMPSRSGPARRGTRTRSWRTSSTCAGGSRSRPPSC